MSNNTKVLTYLIDGQPATARALADVVGLSVQQSQNVCSELYRIGVLDRDDKQHTYALGKQLSKRANKKLLLAAIRDDKTGIAALVKLVASVGGTSRRTPAVSTTPDGVPTQPVVTLTAAPKKIPPVVKTIPEVVPSNTYKVAVRQQVSRFDGLALLSVLRQDEIVPELKRLTSSLSDRLQELARLRESLQELAVAEGLDPSMFDGIGMGETQP
jgi:hypothetical protein